MEFIYILTNPAMPDWVKIGKTKNIEERIKQLSNTSVPLPFECYAYMEVPDDLVSNAEISLHNLAKEANNKQKEYFEMSPEKAVEYLRNVALNNKDYKVVVNSENTDVEEDKKRTTFKSLGIKKGTELVLLQNPSLKCVVEDEINQVRYLGEVSSITSLAKRLLNRKSAVNGFTCFSVDGEISLYKMRQAIN